MSQPPLKLRCPLCGASNACAMAALGIPEAPCWCRDVEFDAASLERLEPSERGVACICARCARPGAATTEARAHIDANLDGRSNADASISARLTRRP